MNTLAPDIDQLPWVSGHLDSSTFEWFKIALSDGLARQTAFALAESRIRNAGARVPRGKFERQWMNAIKWTAHHGNIVSAQSDALQPSQPSIDYHRVDAIVREGIGLYDLWEQSPVRFDDDQAHTEEIIDVIFPDNPLLCVGVSQSIFTTRARETFRGELHQKQFIVAQKMTRPSGVTGLGHRSAHSLDNTGPWAHYVVEFDLSAKNKTGQDTPWAPLIRDWTNHKISVSDACVALLDHFAGFAPLGLVLHSAGKSCHGWFPLAGAAPTQLTRFRHEALTLGADPALFRNRSQFVRMPDGIRAENGRRQTTYYLNPEVFQHATTHQKTES